jgi:hypothetical protein
MRLRFAAAECVYRDSASSNTARSPSRFEIRRIGASADGVLPAEPRAHALVPRGMCRDANMLSKTSSVGGTLHETHRWHGP